MDAGRFRDNGEYNLQLIYSTGFSNKASITTPDGELNAIYKSIEKCRKY